MNKVFRFLKDEDGPTAVEYAVMLAMIIAVCLAGVGLLGQNTAASFQYGADEINSRLVGSGIAPP